jgi:serine/threonine protein kinase
MAPVYLNKEREIMTPVQQELKDPKSVRCRNRCKVCLSFPLRHHLRFSMFGDEDCMWDFDDHIYEFMNVERRPRSDRDSRVDQDTAYRTAKNAHYRVEKLRKEWYEMEAQHKKAMKTNNTEEQKGLATSATAVQRKVIAPFEWNEVKIGRLLGSGGFSTVKEVIGFESTMNQSFQSDLDSIPELLAKQVLVPAAPPKPYTKLELTSRDFLKRHVFHHKLEHAIDASSERKKRSQPECSMPRYAVKHLRVSITKDNDRYGKAAVDLALEAQLLKKLDHPNIVKIRAICREGAEAFKEGKHTSFFFVMDLLPDTLDGRIWEWRKSLKKYRSRCNFVWGKEKYLEKIRNLLIIRLGAARDIGAALEHMHSKRIINRDVKTANVGFNVHGDIKIYDLGLSRLLPADADKDNTYKLSCVGTKSYMAPEIRNKDHYNMSVDVYSFGIVLWELMSLSTPMDSFYKPNKTNGPKKTNGEGSSKKYGIWLPLCECWPTAVQNLIQEATCHEPLRRPRMSQARSTLQQQLHDMGLAASGGTTRRKSSFSLECGQAEVDREIRSSLENRTTFVDESSHRSYDENESGKIVVAPKNLSGTVVAS